MINKKEYGNYSLDQLKQLRDGLGMVRAISWQLEEAFKVHPEALREVLTAPYFWANVYELPLVTHLGLLSQISGMDDAIITASEQDDPQQAALDFLFEEDDEPNEGRDLKSMITLNYALMKTLDCLMTYNWYMHELMERIKEGDQKALFMALRIDRSAVACPSIADRIALAEIEDDCVFFDKLSGTLSKGPPKQSTDYPDLRYILPYLEESGVLAHLSVKEKHHLFVEELRVYPEGDNSADNLKRFILRWRERRYGT